MNYDTAIVRSEASILATNKVIKNTYILLSATLVFSALMAALSMAIRVSPGASLGMSIGAILLVWFVLPRFKDSAAGIGIVFAFTGLLGMSLGPLLNHYMNLPNGSELIGTALGGTGVIFFALSAYALKTRKDFSFMAGFLIVGFVVVLAAAIVGLFTNIPGLQLAISAAVVLLMSGFILYDTSNIIHGGETNYIMATVGLYLSIHNLFVHLLHLLSAFSGDD